MVRKKAKSKRVTLKDKYKIQRRVVESHRKARKQTKRNAKAGIVRHDDKKKKRDPGVPNSWPFKNELLLEIERARERAEEKLRRLKEERKHDRLETMKEHRNERSAETLEDLMAKAAKSREEYNVEHDGGADREATNGAAVPADGKKQISSHGRSSRRAHLRDLKKVIDSSDVVLQILDARDPIGTRIHPSVENAILSHHDKRMVLVLNKIDLIPKSAVRGWLTALRRAHPAVAIRAGTNQNRSSEKNKSTVGRGKGDGALQSTNAVGVEGLMGLLKNYARNDRGGGGSSGAATKKSNVMITVGIIGYPNVGKSSILNSLKRHRAVGVSPRPGFTASIQEVVLDRSVRLLDSPGVVFDDNDDDDGDGTKSSALLQNCVDPDSVSDPISAVESLIKRCTIQSLVMTYGIPAFPPGDVMAFLAMIAKRIGKVKKGGIPDKIGAAKAVLRDWNSGEIPYYTPPPTLSPSSAMAVQSIAMNEDDEDSGKGNAFIVSKFDEEFDVSKMDGEVMEGLEKEEEIDEMDFVQLNSLANDARKRNDKLGEKVLSFLKGKDEDDDKEEDMDEDSDDDDDNMGKKGSRGRMADVSPAAPSSVANRFSLAEEEDYDFDAM